MDADRFDDVLRSLTETRSRRGVARMIAGLAAAGPLGILLGLADTEAKKKHKKKKHKKKRKPACSATNCRGCCDGATCYEGDSQNSCGRGGVACAACSGDEICDAGECVCENECCADADCPAGSGRTCQEGACRCPSGQGNSGGVCGTPPIGCVEPQVPCNEGTCCSGTCAPGEGGIDRCQPSAEGEPCVRDDYCEIGLLCVGFVCRSA
jgi:hypothetical protein